MKRSMLLCALMFLISSGIGLPTSFAQGLGATQVGPDLQNFADCQNRVQGHKEHLIADRLQAKLDKSASLTPEDRDIWVAEIHALRQVKPSQPYNAPDPKNPQRYFLGLTNDEQTAINSMHNQFVQENNLACDKKYGGMTRYSPGSDQSGQARYEKELKDNIQTATDIATIPVGPLPSPHPKTLEQMHEEIENLKRLHLSEIERIAQLSVEQAKELLLTRIEEQVRAEAAQRVRQIEERAREEADARAREIITLAIQRCASDQVSEAVVSVVPLPNEEMKGRIIGREGRNIRALEAATGVDLIIDDTPEAVILSGFDPVRREVARVALTKLILDGRIHPARIEEVVAKARQEVDAIVREAGERAAL